MRGIELCAECAYYNMKSHNCTRGCKIDPDSKKGEDVRFFVDCPLPDVQPVKHGKWLSKCEGDIYEFSECSECGNMESCETPYCAQCGTRMIKDGDANE